ncbi:HPP family protein [Haloarcula salinisoli]|uniref:HPP family protein n=1 Tax=Haloarcula salinisoli TaxID=2487746 RepID=A0A8J7YIA4_9EURY|nr:HPP family protein [Halomicroarcula salinisoli]MBX0303856.1 HPP family protein [Halomicroarcula salinisoli]
MTDGSWARQASHAGALLSALGAVVWLSGLPFLFPSLGPTAYLFATQPSARQSAPRRVLGGHAVGVIAGLVAYHAIAGEVIITASMGPASMDGLRLAASGVVAVALTTAGMTLTDTGHAPACATTLIVGLGILAAPLEGAIIMLAVGVLVGEQALLNRLV